MFVGKGRSQTYSGAPKRCFSQVGSNLTQKHLNKLERFARDKHSSLLQIFIYYGCKKLYIIGPSVRIHKTFLNNKDLKKIKFLKKFDGV